MSNFFNTYPYTDFHELNLDWILAQIKELETRLDNISDDILNAAKAYTDEQIAITQANIDALEADVEAFKVTINGRIDNEVLPRIDALDQGIVTLKTYIDDQIVISNARTDQAIANAKEEIYVDLQAELANIKVINYFTGDLVGVQEMFNYLAGLHATDGITYNQINARNKTYASLAALNATYTDIAMHGNVLIV